MSLDIPPEPVDSYSQQLIYSRYFIVMSLAFIYCRFVVVVAVVVVVVVVVPGRKFSLLVEESI